MARISMKLMMIVLLLGACVEKKSTPTKWDGIPEKRVCSYVHSYQHSLITCIADGKVYVCIQDEDYHVLCTRDTVEIKCTNIINVETVCPAKP